MATNGSALVEEARKHLAKLHKETGADVQKDLGQSWEKHGTGPDMSKQENETLFAPKNAAMDMQKKKEDRLEVKSPINAAQIKRDRTKKEYDDYVKSDEYKKRVTENDQKARAEAAAQMFLNPGQPMPQPKVIQDEREMQLRAAMETAEQEYNAAEDDNVIAEDLEAITGLSNEERRELEQYAVNQIRDQNLPVEMVGVMPTAQQEASGLIGKYGKQRVDEMAETFMRQENADMARKVDEKTREFVNKRGLSDNLADIATFPAAALSSLVGAVGQLQGMARNTGRYKTLDPYATGTIGDTFVGAARGQHAQNLVDDFGGGFLGKAASVGYQGVMSAADSIARAVLGGGAVGGAALAATGSFSQTMAEASRQGASPAQAALMATVNSGIEALSEKIPLGNLIRTAKGTGAKTVLLNALRQMGIEATTEEISLLGTVLAEAAILQEKSSYKQDIIAGITSGLSVDDAIIEANKKILGEALNTLLVSAVSGGASSLTGSYADARGLFAQEQEQNNPALNQPKQSDVVKSVEDLRQKYGQPEAQQAAEQPKQAAAPAVEAQTTQTTEQAAQAHQQPQEEPRAKQSTVIDSVVETIQRNGGNVTNRMAESVMSDPTAMQKLGITPEGTKAEQRRRVKEEMEKLFQTQNQPDETAANVPKTEPMQATETSEQATKQASAPTTDVQMGASNQSTEGGQQTQTQQTEPEMQRDRINSVREQAIPVTDPQGGKVSEFAGNAYQSSLTPDSFTDSIKRLVEEGQVSHDVQTNEESLRKGAEMISKAGTERQAVNQLRDFANTGKFTPEHIAMGTLLYQDLTSQIDQQEKSGSVDTNLKQDAEDVFVSLQQMATNSGRALQLYNLFRKMTPESQVNVLEREVQRNIEKMQKAGTVKKGYQSSIDPELTTMYRQAADEFQKAKGADAKKFAEQKMQDIQNVIYASEASKLPTTFKAKWDAWRYMAMLGNVKTQIRNLAGNAAMIPYTGAKRMVGAILEAGTGLDKSQRTKSFAVDRQLMQWAKQDSVNVKSVLDGSAKLGDSTAKNPMAEGVKTFGDSWIGERFNELQGLIDKTVSGGDMLFKNREYTRSLAGFLKARGYTAADVQTEGRVPVEVMNEARNYAVNEALKATFNDTNMLSDFLANDLRYKGENPIGKAVNMLGEGIMPFRKTPANVVMRFKDYSPAGLVQGMWNAAFNVRNGKVSAATAIDQLASGLTGTAAMVFGYMLAGGIDGVKITGSGTDEDEKRQNHQNYALEFSVNGQEYSYTIDWASPANLPLFLGANLREMNEAQDTASFLTALTNAGRGALEPLLQLSCLSSLNDMVESARYAEEGEAIYTLLARAATSYLTQGIPSIARQATQAATEYKKTTFTTTDDPVLQDMQKTATGLGVGDAYKTDKRNAWGEKEKQGEALSSITGLPAEVTRAIDAFFNPGTLKKIDNSAVEQEITRLNKAGMDVTPDTAARTISYVDKDGQGHDDVRLTEEQYQTLAETQGQTARQLVEDMIQSKAYQALTDEQKAEAIDAAYLYARKTGEIAAIGDDHTGYDQSWMYDVNKGGGANELMRRVFNSSLNTSMSDLDNAWDKGYNEETFSRDMETAYDSYKKAPASMRGDIYAEATGTAKRYMEARDKGLTHKEVISAIENVVKVHGTGAVNKETGKPTVRDIDRRKAIASTPGLSESAKDILMKAYMADYDPSDESPETTEFKYDYARKEMGLSATEYADTYKAYLDSSKKRDKIAAIRALGYDYGTALALYNLYNGRKKNELIKLYG